ncbi:hypothetical protein V8C35DRAFT_286847 [Trichoderma chlorosporum]
MQPNSGERRQLFVSLLFFFALAGAWGIGIKGGCHRNFDAQRALVGRWNESPGQLGSIWIEAF